MELKYKPGTKLIYIGLKGKSDFEVNKEYTVRLSNTYPDSYDFAHDNHDRGWIRNFIEDKKIFKEVIHIVTNWKQEMNDA